MSKIIIGIDPDSDKHGVAIYEDGKLIGLERLGLMGVQGLLNSFRVSHPGIDDIEVHIEDVCANNAIFRAGANQRVNMSIARRLGMVQQSQSELERMLIRFHIVTTKHKISKMWKKDKTQFEKVTGWTGRSNEDTRSAAYFGFLGLK